MKGSLFDGDMKRRMFHFIRDQFQRMVYCSSRERVQRKKVPETRVQRMICVKFQRTEWVCGRGSTSPVTTVVMVFCQSSKDMVISLWFHQCHGARASIEGGFFESKKATKVGYIGGPAAGVRNTPRLRGDVIGEFCRFSENELKLCM